MYTKTGTDHSGVRNVGIEVIDFGGRGQGSFLGHSIEAFTDKASFSGARKPGNDANCGLAGKLNPVECFDQEI